MDESPNDLFDRVINPTLDLVERAMDALHLRRHINNGGVLPDGHTAEYVTRICGSVLDLNPGPLVLARKDS